MNKLNICIDIDGTITNPYHFLPYLNDMYNKNLTEEQFITHKMEELCGVEFDDLLKLLHNDYIHAYSEADVVENAKDIIIELFANHNLYFVTARSQHLKDITQNWLTKHGLGEVALHLLGSDYKVDKARELNCNIFIEDNPDNAYQLASDGLTVILIDNNYNRNVEHENIVRVNNWNDIKEFISTRI
ncbi:MAG: hydrolase [Peptostreptococcaceae bacterium]|nr:hydrolase [Peptostreptococcaceae bacterium]MBP3928886.1 hydrolase [Peptostreptococcaceae bacterium]